MNEVSVPEFDLLSIARAVMGLTPIEEVDFALSSARVAPEVLGPVAMTLLEDTLARGATLWLMRAGGAWRSSTIDGESIRVGRLWERHPQPSLRFSAVTFDFLQWMTRAPLTGSRPEPLDAPPSLTPADELFLYAACALVEGTRYETSLARHDAVRASTSCWLGFTRALAAAGTPPPRLTTTMDLRPLLFLLEGLQDDLAGRSLRCEQAKMTMSRPEELIGLGASQESILNSFLAAADRLGRRDVCGFLVEAGARWLALQPSAAALISTLDPTSPLGDRQRARHAAGAFLRALTQLRMWDEQHRATRFIDSGYEPAQLLVQQWERLGHRGFESAAALHSDLTAL